jgi:hypothetical protein
MCQKGCGPKTIYEGFTKVTRFFVNPDCHACCGLFTPPEVPVENPTEPSVADRLPRRYYGKEKELAMRFK